MVRAKRWVRLFVLVGAASCADAGPGTPADILPADFTAALSDALLTPPAISPTGLSGRHTYVSMRPGTIPNGIRLDIRNRQTAAFSSHAIVDGGLDPVAIAARAGDTLDLIAMTTTATLRSAVIVAASRRPGIVRTVPPRGKRGVPLNAIVVVVFSEPVDASVLTSGTVRLMAGATLVQATVAFTGAEHFAVSVSPAQPLEADREYTLVVTTDVTDLAGERLEAGAQSNFFTESAASPVTPAAPAAFVQVGAMVAPRSGHSATLLPDGRVLIAGGAGRSAEQYDPTTRAFTPTGSMLQAHGNHRAVALADGRVFIVDGANNSEIYDPATGSFTSAGRPLTQQFVTSATLLENGRVLIGGVNRAELFNPATGTYQLAGAYRIVNPAWPEYYYDATLLDDGRVLFDGMPDRAQIYDPATNAFTAIGNLGLDGLELHTSTLLPGGKVLVAGGGNDEFGGRTEIASLFDPATGQFTRTGSMHDNRAAHAAVRLSDGSVLILGGDTNINGAFGGSLRSAEIYDPASATFAPAGTMHVGRTLAAATLLKNGDVLVTGGYVYCLADCAIGPTDAAELLQRSVAGRVIR